MSAMERTTSHRQPLSSNPSSSSNIRAFDESRRDPQRATFTSGPSTNFSPDDPIPLFLSDLQGEPDPREFAPVAASRRKSILTRVLAGGLVVSAFAILVAVAAFNSNVTHVVVDKATPPMGGASEDQSAIQASTQPAARQVAPEDPVLVSAPVTVASANANALPEETPSRESVVGTSQTAPQSQASAAPTGNEAAVPRKTLDAETLAALMKRARSLLALGDIAAARLLLERCANAQDAPAAFLLAQTYDPAVLGVRDVRSTAPDPEMARNWYRTAASLGSADAQQRLAQLQN